MKNEIDYNGFRVKHDSRRRLVFHRFFNYLMLLWILEALSDVKSAIGFHIEAFGPQVLDDASSAIDVFIAEAGVAV